MGKISEKKKQIIKAMLEASPLPKKKAVEKPPVPLESNIQQQCITWFRYQYRRLWEDGVLFHIPNEGIRQGGIGQRMKREGIVRGVADICLALGRNGYNALYIEMKRPGNYQSPYQKAWEQGISKHGNKYVVCKSLEEFKEIVTWYINSNTDEDNAAG